MILRKPHPLSAEVFIIGNFRPSPQPALGTDRPTERASSFLLGVMSASAGSRHGSRKSALRAARGCSPYAVGQPRFVNHGRQEASHSLARAQQEIRQRNISDDDYESLWRKLPARSRGPDTQVVASHATFSKGDCRHHDLSPESGDVSRPSLAAAKGSSSREHHPCSSPTPPDR